MRKLFLILLGLLFISCEYIEPAERERGFTTYVWFNPNDLSTIDMSAYQDKEIYTIDNGNMFKISWAKGQDYQLKVEFPGGIIDKVSFMGSLERIGEDYPNKSTFTKIESSDYLLEPKDGKYQLIIYTDCYQCQ